MSEIDFIQGIFIGTWATFVIISTALYLVARNSEEMTSGEALEFALEVWPLGAFPVTLVEVAMIGIYFFIKNIFV